MADMRETDRPVPRKIVGLLETVRRYRNRVDVEISNASEYGARWWSRRLVEVCEKEGLVHLEKEPCSRECPRSANRNGGH